MQVEKFASGKRLQFGVPTVVLSRPLDPVQTGKTEKNGSINYGYCSRY